MSLARTSALGLSGFSKHRGKSERFYPTGTHLITEEPILKRTGSPLDKRMQDSSVVSPLQCVVSLGKDEHAGMRRSCAPLLLPRAPCSMKKLKVLPVVSDEDPSLLSCTKELQIIGIAFRPEVASHDRLVPHEVKLRSNADRYIMVEIKVRQRSGRVSGDASLNSCFMAVVVGERRPERIKGNVVVLCHQCGIFQGMDMGDQCPNRDA